MSRLYMRFPDWKQHAFTMSYDDGVLQDIRLIEIMNKYGIKGTFNLNSDRIVSDGVVSQYLSVEQVRELYTTNGMEVALHGLTHATLAMIPTDMCAKEVLLDRVNLEEMTDSIVRGMAYPNASFSDDVITILRQCGIVYGRTTDATYNFTIPLDWFRFNPTCHHNDDKLMNLARSFVEDFKYGQPALFYLWGHSYEFDNDNNWKRIEEFAQYIGNRENIWYATNLQVCDYVTAFRRLVFSMNEKRVYNPSNMDVYFQIDDKGYCVEPGEHTMEECFGGIFEWR